MMKHRKTPGITRLIMLMLFLAVLLAGCASGNIENSEKITVKKVLCYGDSNTYGFDPRMYSSGRYEESEIWTSVLADLLGDGWEVINEGMNGRRIPFEGRYEYVEGLMQNLSGGDWFVIMLGSNDIP